MNNDYKSPDWYSTKIASTRKRKHPTEMLKGATDRVFKHPYGYAAATMGAGALMAYLLSEKEDKTIPMIIGAGTGLLAGPYLKQRPTERWRERKEFKRKPDYQAQMDELQYDGKHGVQTLKAIRDVAKEYPGALRDTYADYYRTLFVDPAVAAKDRTIAGLRRAKKAVVDSAKWVDRGTARIIRGDR